ncbi:hypothetical protein Mic7113_1991 [Allocoleopsis franciscana PCC 7113]|uniref:Uncharacterized protein n=1 Tax=Allocoleopsis franciscana PCC 7113 TaxID=1173027 RepID=K9WDK5_9CYAN|nr:hypothetical protein Mic7113_1991 [Allocoleopsis franciscana PCC 7113]
MLGEAIAYNRVNATEVPIPCKSSYHLKLKPLCSANLSVANTIARLPTAPAKLIEVILAGVKLLEQQQDIYQGRLQELQQDALKGLEASQRGEVVDGATAMAQIRANMRSRYSSP